MRARRFVLALMMGGFALRGQPPPPAADTNATTDPFQRAMLPPDLNDPAVKTNLPIRETSPGIFQLGEVRIDQHQRTVSFPARLNLDHGPMEYFLVTRWGKTHESILATDTEPFRIHLAMLLLDTNAGAAATASNGPPVSAGGFVSHPSKQRLPGEAVSIEIAWTSGGREIRKPAADLFVKTDQKSVLRQGDWVYTGSRVVEGLFLAEIDGSIISLVTDAEALINNEGPGHDDDTVWAANTNSLPPTNAIVEVSIKLAPAGPK